MAPPRRGGQRLFAALAGAGALALVGVLLALRGPSPLDEARAYREQVLRPWALGLGSGPAPAAEEVERLTAALSDQGEEEAELRRALVAHTWLLRGDPAGLAEPQGETQRLVQALLLCRAGRRVEARRALGAGGASAPAVWAEVWRGSVDDADGAAACLRAAGPWAKGDPSARAVVEAALEVALGARLDALLNVGRAQAFREEAARLLERAEGVLGAEEAASLARACLEGRLDAWGGRLAAACGVHPDLPRLRALLRAAAVLGGTPPSPAVGARLQERLESLSARADDPAAVKAAVTLDLAGFDELGWRAEPPRAYRDAVGRLLLPGDSGVVPKDVILVGLRHDIAPPTVRELTESFVFVFLSNCAAPLVGWPDGQARRFCELRELMEQLGSGADDPPKLTQALASALRALEPGLREDLAPTYQARALRLGLRLVGNQARSDPLSRGEAAQHMEDWSRRLLALLPHLRAAPTLWRDAFLDGWVYRARALDLRHERDQAGALVDEARRSWTEASTGASPAEARFMAEAWSEVLVSFAGTDGRLPALGDRFALLEEAVATVADSPGSEAHLVALSFQVEALRKAGRLDEAEAALAPHLAEGIRLERRFGREALRVALARGAKDVARQRLRDVIEARGREDEAVKAMLREAEGAGVRPD